METSDLAARLLARCDALAACSEEEGRITRPSYSLAMRQAHDLVTSWMRAAGMAVYEDAVGNLIGSYPADRSNARTLVIGSHLDSVRDAGRYDGPLGVLVGLAAVEALAAQGRKLPFAIEVVAFADEEGLRFHSSFLGSSAFVGRFDEAWLELRDGAGISLAAALEAFGGAPEVIAQDARPRRALLGYLEVHIEQGPVLEREGLALGVVSAITGGSRTRVVLRGTAGHAGTTPMQGRADALCAAAEIILASEALARSTPDLVATVGQISAYPGASNVIPGAVELSIDLRHQDNPTWRQCLGELERQAQALAAARGVAIEWEVVQTYDAVPMDGALRAHLAAALVGAGCAVRELPSGAGHDAAIIGAHTPAAMLFVRCAGGISHNPAEAVAVGDVATAIAATLRFVERLAG